MSTALLIDFGSTYTKLRAIDLDRRIVLGAGQGPSTVTTDITIGMELALLSLERRLGRLPLFKYRLASSSAAGGLRMITIGLVPELTTEAARQAALGAGAKLVATFSYNLTLSDINKIMTIAPDIVLLAGGTDGGDLKVILHNARMLANSELACPIIYAGNRSGADEVTRFFKKKTLLVTENVMADFNVLNIEPARDTIRQVFINHIVHAKGIDKAQTMFDHVLMPTPAAVLEGARLLADGSKNARGLGELMVIDPGGATTDVHSIATGDSATPGVIIRGLREPRVKRSVEGDLGMRHNAGTIIEVAGMDSITRDSGLDEGAIKVLTRRLSDDVAHLPDNSDEQELDQALVRAAVDIAIRRHCGTIETVYLPSGPVNVQRGKDLSALKTVIGTGGPLVHAKEPLAVMSMAVASPLEPTSLRPRAPRLLLDNQYVLYACGLLASVEPDAALELGLRHLTSVN